MGHHTDGMSYLRRSQFIPNISKDPTVTVVNFVRTPMWYIPGVSSGSYLERITTLFWRFTLRYPQPILPYSGFTKWAFTYIPFVHIIYRFIIAAIVSLMR